jgi:NTE family protein
VRGRETAATEGIQDRSVSISINQLRRRTTRGPRTAFVLSGGGNQAVSQVGMLRALLERDVQPDVLIGTSAGAWNASVIAANPTLGGVEALVETWEDLRGDVVFPEGRLARAWNLLKRDDHLFSDQGLRALLDNTAIPETFEELARPLRVVATDLESGEEVVFARGPLVPALLASAALPGLFPPARHDGRILVDGAVVDTVPLWHALAGPVDRVYVLNITSELMRRPLRSPIDVAIRAFTISRKQRFEAELRGVPAGIDVHVLPAPADDREFFDFSDPLMIIEEAHHLAERYLDEAEAARARRTSTRRNWWRRSSA